MKKVLIIGAGFLQDFVIRKAKSMGYYTLTVDADPSAIGFKHADKYEVINIVDEEACYEFAKKENIDGVLTAATDYGVLTASYIAEKMNLRSTGYEAAKLIKNKYLVRKCLFENHVDDTEQTFEVNKDTDIELLSKEVHYPVMVKPCDGSGSRGASRVDCANQLRDACQYAMNGSITHRAEIEPFIDGREYGAESLVVDGEVHVLAIMKKWMTEPPYYAELGHAIPSELPESIEQKAIDCVKNAIKTLGVKNGSVNMDMLITDKGAVHIIDIGARMGGNMIGPCIIPYGTGINYMANMLKNAVNDELDWNEYSHQAVATKLIAFKQSGYVKKLPDFSKLEQDYDVEIYHHLEQDMKINEYHTNLDGCGYIIAKRDTVDDAEKIANTVLNILEKELFIGGNDIAK